MTKSDQEAVIVLALRHIAALAREQIFLRDGKKSHAKSEAAMARIFLNAAIQRAGGLPS